MTQEEIAELKAGDGIVTRCGIGSRDSIHIISKVTATQIVVSYPSYQYRFDKNGFLRGERGFWKTRIERRATPEETAKQIEINAENTVWAAENARRNEVADEVQQALAVKLGVSADRLRVLNGEKWSICIEGLTEEEAVGLSR